jgi:hypothetical protein
MLLSSLPVVHGALPGVLDGDIKQRFPAITWGRVKLIHLVVSNVLGGDTAQLLGGVPDGVSRYLKW